MNYATIFQDLDDFRSYADGLQADTAFRQLLPSIRATAMEMEKVITKVAFDAITTVPVAQQGQEPPVDAFADGRELLKTALANGALYRYQIFATVKKAGSDAALYKYQHEELKASYVENYWKAMDQLLDWIDTYPDFPGLSETTYYEERQELPVRNAEEFHRYFGIERSSYFFAKALYLIRDCWAKLLPRVRGFEENEAVMDAARKAVCYHVIARVVKTWDLTEFPRSIRFDYNHEYSKGSSSASRDQLYASILSEAVAAEAQIDALRRHASDDDATGNSNVEKDKFYLSM